MKSRSLRSASWIVLCALGLTVASAWAGDKEKDKAGDVAKIKAMFTADAYIDHIKYLASDELGGRGSGQEGNNLATEYIAEKFKEAGCKPGGVDGTYFQPFEIPRGKKLVDEKTGLEVSGLDSSWKIRKDWIPLPFSKTEVVEGPLAFAGYGIEAPEYNYNDYADFNPEGKVLLVFRYEPKAADEKADFGGKEASKYSLFITKARQATEKKAKALLIVNPYKEGATDDPLYPFDSWSSRDTYDLPMLHITRDTANAILQKAGMPDLKTLQEKLEKDRKPQTADLKDMTAKVSVTTEADSLKTRNVLGYLEGDGSTDEVIVVGAHHDHLGTNGTRINNGADDNASGSAGVLELVRAFGHGPKLRRNILFMTFSGEEMGLLGSVHFVNHPTIDLKRIKAMINMDMIGRLNQDKFEIFGMNTAVEFEDIVKRAAEDAGLKYKPGKNLQGDSDHSSFYRKKIPILFPFTGLHKQYHQPEDDWELIDSEGAAQILQMMYPIVRDVANMETGPTPPVAEKPKDEAAKAEDAKPADGADAAPARPQRPRIMLGISPDYAYEKPGLRVQDVSENRSAAKAGMQAGDVIVQIGSHPIKGIESYMEALQTFKPDDVTDIVVERGGQRVTLKVTLTAPPRSRRE